jgi:hypothetical protein
LTLGGGSLNVVPPAEAPRASVAGAAHPALPGVLERLDVAAIGFWERRKPQSVAEEEEES